MEETKDEDVSPEKAQGNSKVEISGGAAKSEGGVDDDGAGDKGGDDDDGDGDGDGDEDSEDDVEPPPPPPNLVQRIRAYLTGAVEAAQTYGPPYLQNQPKIDKSLIEECDRAEPSAKEVHSILRILSTILP
jgi:hypothetical protein